MSNAAVSMNPRAAKSAVTPVTGDFAAEFARVEQGPLAGAPLWLQRARVAALSRFLALGLPSRRHEEWKYSDTTKRFALRFRLADAERDVAAADLAPYLAGGETIRLVFVNGHFSPPLSAVEELPAGVSAASLATVLRERPRDIQPWFAADPARFDEPFRALNTAFAADGALVRVARDTVVDKPIELLFVGVAGAEPAMAHPRNLFAIEAGAAATIIESYVTLGEGAAFFTNGSNTVKIGANARLEHVKVLREGGTALHVALNEAAVARDGRYVTRNLSVVGGFARNDWRIALDGPGAEGVLDGLYLTHGGQHVDNHTVVDHRVPRCRSDQLYKGVLDGDSSAVFNGKIFVRPDAQQTNAFQSNRNLLLSRAASVDTKPQLEIFADDVKCSHGATVGRLDDAALFYLRARGIDPELARRLLTRAFAGEVLDRVGYAPLRHKLYETLFDELPWRDFEASAGQS